MLLGTTAHGQAGFCKWRGWSRAFGSRCCIPQAETGQSPRGIGGTGLIDRKFVGLVGC